MSATDTLDLDESAAAGIQVPLDDAKALQEQALVELVMAEAKTDEEGALHFLLWLDELVALLLRTEDNWIHMQDGQLGDRAYDVFDAVVPHDAQPQPGSVHEALLERYGINGLTHQQDIEGDRTYCAVRIILTQRA